MDERDSFVLENRFPLFRIMLKIVSLLTISLGHR